MHILSIFMHIYLKAVPNGCLALPCSINSRWGRRGVVLTSYALVSTICCGCVPVPGSLQIVSLSIPFQDVCCDGADVVCHQFCFSALISIPYLEDALSICLTRLASFASFPPSDGKVSSLWCWRRFSQRMILLPLGNPACSSAMMSCLGSQSIQDDPEHHLACMVRAYLEVAFLRKHNHQRLRPWSWPLTRLPDFVADDGEYVYHRLSSMFQQLCRDVVDGC